MGVVSRSEIDVVRHAHVSDSTHSNVLMLYGDGLLEIHTLAIFLSDNISRIELTTISTYRMDNIL